MHNLMIRGECLIDMDGSAVRDTFALRLSLVPFTPRLPLSNSHRVLNDSACNVYLLTSDPTQEGR